MRPVGKDLRKERIHLALVVAVLLVALPATADKLIYAGCGGICAVDPVPGATPAPLIPGLIDLMEEVRGEEDEQAKIVTQDLHPNGQTLAITSLGWAAAPVTDIWSIQLDGSDLKLLVVQERWYVYKDWHGTEVWDPSFASMFGLAWSPEGDLLAYSDGVAIEYAGLPNRINFLTLGGSPPDSVSPRERTYFHSRPAGGIPGRGWSLDWHTDGRLFYASGGSVWSINRDGTGKNDWVSGFNPTISSDGRVAFSRLDSLPEILVFDTAESPISVRAIAQGCCAAWSPDSQRIAYFADGYLRVMNADGSNQIDICPAEYRLSGDGYHSDDLDWIGEPADIPTAIRPRSWGQIKRDHLE